MAGFGSSLFFYRACLAAAINLGRVLIIAEGDLPHANLLEPWTNCPMPSPDDQDVMRCTFYGDGDIDFEARTDSSYVEPPAALWHVGRLWWGVHALAFLARPRSDLAPQGFDAHRHAGIHVRRTDKHHEAPVVPVIDFLRQLDHVGGSAPISVRVVTDDPDTVLPDFDISRQRCRRTFSLAVDGDPGHTNDSVIDGVIDLQYSDPLVVTFSSNFAHWAMALKIIHDLETGRSGRIAVLDAEWFGWLVVDQSRLLGAEWITNASIARRAGKSCGGSFYAYRDLAQRRTTCTWTTVRFRYSFR
ncbi:hypothetical protein PBRA_003411 [Plasmodiophora brassicae]|uniref:GT23 domain-containing protein n=1 Tax=Plasmodiophora brassicae TaxID=37360 RepID=A0A0G4J8V6_PLABS|nr:hypothetical protein PBRA_003411 [Plasmodiophora brassicae]